MSATNTAGSLARRYAKALFELCNESHNHAVIGKQLESFLDTWQGSEELQAVLRGSQDKEKLLNNASCPSLRRWTCNS
jgi:F0F1-type ATP synthase delta subunit